MSPTIARNIWHLKQIARQAPPVLCEDPAENGSV
jgi:hypothetical protein